MFGHDLSPWRQDGLFGEKLQGCLVGAAIMVRRIQEDYFQENSLLEQPVQESFCPCGVHLGLAANLEAVEILMQDR